MYDIGIWGMFTQYTNKTNGMKFAVSVTVAEPTLPGLYHSTVWKYNAGPCSACIVFTPSTKAC